MPEVILSLGEFQLVALTRALRNLRAIERQSEVIRGETRFAKREPSPLLMSAGPRELADQVREVASATSSLHPSRMTAIGHISAHAAEIAQARTALDALRAYHELVDLPDSSSDSRVHFSADRLRIYVRVEPVENDDDDYAAAISTLFARCRAEGRLLSASEQAALDVAEWRLRGGIPLRTPFACLGTSGFRAIQTWLSLADPGPDHIRITAHDNALLRGLVVHVEHIDRDMVADKEKIEPYRLPAAWQAARARLRVGAATPCTAFVGRPVFENHVGSAELSAAGFELDLLKTVHLHASACTTMFVNGITDCKIAIERMSADSAVRFMRALSGNVLRDADRQTLSAAFNLNTPLDGLTDRFAIGRRGIELAVAGGFGKIAWDGASNEVPSKPITDQLSFEQLVDLVHAAHEHGLETYLSAGMIAEHMRIAVAAGVDGVGIGTSMHHVDPSTKLMGALKPDAIRDALRIRDEAEATPLGRAAKLLARLDQMHSEGSLSDAEEQRRDALYRAVRSRDEIAATSDLSRVEQLADVALTDSPMLARGRRRLARLRLDRDDRADELGDALARSDAVTVRELLAHD